MRGTPSSSAGPNPPYNYHQRMALAATDLPGAELFNVGIEDLRVGRESEQSLLVEIAAPRLRALGYELPPYPDSPVSPEHRLYGLLAQQPGGGAHSRYNALLARIARFAKAAEHTTPR
jgi:hypothetical protein